MCAELSRKCFSRVNLWDGRQRYCVFNVANWISLYGLSFNLAALKRLYRHAVRYFHPPARFLNGETATRTFHIWDFCRGGSRIVRDLSPADIQLPRIYLPSSLSNIAISVKISAIQSLARNFFLSYFPLGESGKL